MKKPIDVENLSYNELIKLYGKTKAKTDEDQKLLDRMMERIMKLSTSDAEKEKPSNTEIIQITHSSLDN